MATFTTPPTPPSSNDTANFRTRGDAFLAWMETFGNELNTAMNTINTAAAISTDIVDEMSAANIYGTSSSTNAISTGIKTFTTQTGLGFRPGHHVVIRDANNLDGNYVFGTVTGYSSGVLTVDVYSTHGSGTYSSWIIYVSPIPDPMLVPKTRKYHAMAYTYHNVAISPNVSGDVTGTLKITFPQSWSNTMYKIWISGHNHYPWYLWDVVLRGYAYLTDQAWLSYLAQIFGNNPFGNRIRLGHDGTHVCVLIGSTDTVWNYPYIVLREVHACYHNSASLESGWSMEYLTDETGITVSAEVTPDIVWTSGTDGSGSGLDADLWDGGHKTISTSNPSGGADGDVWFKV